MPESPGHAYPTAEHVTRGPPDPTKDPERARSEKWCRVYGIVPVGRQTEQGVKHEFTSKGPVAMPMAVRRKGTDLGSKDAWIFFTHPWAVFHKDATFWNAPTRPRGILEARLLERTDHGFRLFDEVGAGFVADRVVSSYPAALGILRSRTLAKNFEHPLAKDLIRFEIDLLECFRLLTLCLQTRSPINALADLDRLLSGPNLRLFTQGVFDDQDVSIIKQFGTLRRGGTLTEVTPRFRVDEAHFTQSSDVKDGKGRQLVHDLLNEWQAFEQEHGARVQQLGQEIALAERDARKISLDIEREKDEESEENRVTRFLTGRKKVIKKLEEDRAKVVAKEKQLRAEFDAIPGYDRVKGLSDQIEGFKKIVEGVRRLATNIFDHNVSQKEVKTLDELFTKIQAGEPNAYKDYDRRLRAEVFPRLFTAHSVSAYVLRRPDALAGGLSLKNVRRINRMALDLIDYFREARLGEKTLGQVHDDTWGQIEALEARI
ncbi:MAG: hypothetical protein ACAI25_20705 [Planctomycetota bacterium]